jgi:quinol monooxygenase YgiN
MIVMLAPSPLACHGVFMVNEIALITIDPADAAAFEAAVAEAAPLFKSAQGCRGMALERGVEDPTLYRLLVQWESVDHHMVTFRNSEAFQQWRSLVGGYFVGSVGMSHSATVDRYF